MFFLVLKVGVKLKRIVLKKSMAGLVVFAFFCLSHFQAWGVVLHPGAGDPNLVDWVDRPANDVVGRWGENASCVAIAPNYVLTTRHQGGGVGTAVEIGGVTYTVESVWNHPNRAHPTQPEYSVVDLRVAKLHSANLSEYVDLYTDTDEPNHSGYMAVGGFGLGRRKDGELTSGGKVYGYSWQNRSVYKNFTQRWGTNIVTAAQNNMTSSNGSGTIKYNLDIVFSAFDDPGDTVYEASVAEFDSGGGWFIDDGGEWKLAGITRGVEHASIAQAWFRESADPNELDPDTIYAMRVSSYAGWIVSKLDVCATVEEADFDGDCVVGMSDLREFGANWLRDDCSAGNNFCEGSDMRTDGVVDLMDLARFRMGWDGGT